ncbi:hypothetical protein H2O64_09050 [Kordia sp. YSTF-M3]|uniref:DUF4359 domain-containing protein n=1 Tax=Kordia aestuariivivens TaxID=2759037 RepID=A0ABR7Q8B9_9FLAO|nr:hypothetical protein [Kordia aestuariivivens]MBC8754816.1 hypothetical protein [Kordia aestuariivivens]
MRLILVTIISLITLNIHAQSKDEIIKELESVLKSHCVSTDLKNAEIYYNTEEKIFDFGERYDLDTTKITYEFVGTSEEPIYILQFVRDSNPNSSTGFFFDSKKSVYQVLDLIYSLKKLE